jgi:hypothetical protein
MGRAHPGGTHPTARGSAASPGYAGVRRRARGRGLEFIARSPDDRDAPATPSSQSPSLFVSSPLRSMHGNAWLANVLVLRMSTAAAAPKQVAERNILNHIERREKHEYSQNAWLKHLEFIQVIISRLATNSFLIKGWALTISGALFGFAASHLSWSIATVGLLPIIVFWCLDAYFLTQERLFRSLYNAVARQDEGIPPFSLNPAAYRGDHSWIKVFTSRTLVLFYGTLTVAGLVLIVSALSS